MRYLHNDNTDAHYNMAFDQFCLEQLPLDEPLFYLWQNAPAVIIGLNQNAHTEVNLPYLETHGIKLARRVTGGGAVYHDLQNLNYTIVGKTADLQHYGIDTPRPIVEALQRLGVQAILSGRNDILVDGRKVSGYAKRGWRDRTMIHGTLMYDVDIETLSNVLNVNAEKLQVHGIASVRSRVANLKDYLTATEPYERAQRYKINSIKELQTELEKILSRNYADKEVVLSTDQLSAIEQIAKDKFCTWEWNYGHSPSADIIRKRRFECGTIEVHISVAKGRIENLDFIGDFLGREPVSTLIRQLIGIPLDRQEISRAIGDINISDRFDNLTPEQFLNLLLN